MKAWMVATVLLTGCSSVTPDAGHQAVLIRKPLLFGSGGVDATPVQPGRRFVMWTTKAVDVNMLPQSYHLTIDDMMSADGVPLDFAATIRLRVTDAVKIVSAFGENWYANNVEQPFFTTIRDAVKKRGMNEVAINATAADAIDDEVTRAMQAYLREKGIPVELVDVTVGKANPPDAIKTQRIHTAEQEQRIQTEQQTKLAEDQRKAAEQARAEADNAYRVAMQLNPEQFLQLKSIEAWERTCGTGKCTVYTSGVLPTISLGGNR